ncbi:trimeric LpxA-like protein [Ophiobolus disseminans]|uniref:Trimeric LpxA-like protein n=1 Tax=Ophiobolus disseminans TaxID=1469910 RepID=A0A6A6ZZY0_9PLEO|nr:trimeric LpxA-like protein [Ophiobolus disseminans]
MLDREPFLPYNFQLVDYFNNTGNASSRIVEITQGCFKKIVEARWIQSQYEESPVSSYVSVLVATPFHCDYSYNISIDDNVIIGPNCQLLDSTKITIGKDTKIGARVIITTLERPKDPKTLKGACGTKVAKGIYIRANVCIGDSCIVEARVRISNDVIICSRSIVVHDILPDCIARGNPANMHKAYPKL